MPFWLVEGTEIGPIFCRVRSRTLYFRAGAQIKPSTSRTKHAPESQSKLGASRNTQRVKITLSFAHAAGRGWVSRDPKKKNCRPCSILLFPLLRRAVLTRRSLWQPGKRYLVMKLNSGTMKVTLRKSRLGPRLVDVDARSFTLRLRTAEPCGEVKLSRINIRRPDLRRCRHVKFKCNDSGDLLCCLFIIITEDVCDE